MFIWNILPKLLLFSNVIWYKFTTKLLILLVVFLFALFPYIFCNFDFQIFFNEIVPNSCFFSGSWGDIHLSNLSLLLPLQASCPMVILEIPPEESLSQNTSWLNFWTSGCTDLCPLVLTEFHRSHRPNQWSAAPSSAPVQKLDKT